MAGYDVFGYVSDTDREGPFVIYNTPCNEHQENQSASV